MSPLEKIIANKGLSNVEIYNKHHEEMRKLVDRQQKQEEEKLTKQQEEQLIKQAQKVIVKEIEKLFK